VVKAIALQSGDMDGFHFFLNLKIVSSTSQLNVHHQKDSVVMPASLLVS